MRALGAQGVEVTQKSPEEHEQQARVNELEQRAYDRANSMLPLEAARAGHTKTGVGLYQLREQEGTDDYTRAWLERSGRDSSGPISVHTDTVTWDFPKPHVNTPEAGTARVNIYDGPGIVRIKSYDLDYHTLSPLQKIEVLESIDLTFDHMQEEAKVQALRSAPRP